MCRFFTVLTLSLGPSNTGLDHEDKILTTVKKEEEGLVGRFRITDPTTVR